MSKVVTLKNADGVALITIDSPPVNAVSKAVREGLLEAVGEIKADGSYTSAVLACAGRTFMAGADITEFDDFEASMTPDLNDVIAAMEALEIPLVAAIHGTALGGGFETALGCHYRCALPSAKVGLPEVNLGLLPGAGGTQRTPRLVGVEAGLNMIASGKPVAAPAALEMGLIDKVVEGDLLEGATAYAKELAASGAELRRASEIVIDKGSVPEGFFDGFRKGLEKKARGYFAPFKIVDCVEAAVELPFYAALPYERELFVECMNSTQSSSLRHIFFAERQAGRIPGLGKDVAPRDIKKIAVIGGGTMGGGIAMNFANAGIAVVMVEINDEALERGLTIIRKNYENTLKKGRLTQEKFDKCMGLISGTLDYADIADADMVIEAVFENMELKKKIFAKLDATCKPGAILASNTSTLDVDEIAAATNRPEDVIGLHFFSPANIMRLLEIIRGAKTSPEVLATSMKIAKTIRKVGVMSGVCFGFIGNRMMEGYIRETGLMLLEGAKPEQIDRVITGFGMAMGPCAVMDLAGVDVRCKVVMEAQKDGILPEDERYNAVFGKLFENERFGLKTGKGVYKYEAGSRKPIPDPEVEAMIDAEAKRLGVEQREISDQEILERCIYPLINIGAAILEEGISYRSGDIDLVWLNGYGFPAFRGGPMHYADTVGLDKVVDAINGYAEKLGADYWQPASLLAKLAKEGKTFGSM